MMELVRAEYEVDVGLGKIVIAHPPTVLTAIGIGSCVIVCMYDLIAETAGMAHIMLPDSEGQKFDATRPAKFAKMGVQKLFIELIRCDAKPSHIVAKIVGGAQIFYFKQALAIGRNNINAVREALKSMGVPIVASDVGGNMGRSVWFYPETGKVIVKTKGVKVVEI